MSIKRLTKYPNRLKELREKTHLTQTQLALRLAFHDSQDGISKWEKGIGMPSVQNLFKLSRFYGISPYDIYPDT